LANPLLSFPSPFLLAICLYSFKKQLLIETHTRTIHYVSTNIKIWHRYACMLRFDERCIWISKNESRWVENWCGRDEMKRLLIHFITNKSCCVIAINGWCQRLRVERRRWSSRANWDCDKFPPTNWPTSSLIFTHYKYVHLKKELLLNVMLRSSLLIYTTIPFFFFLSIAHTSIDNFVARWVKPFN
jgi:hypothetical protein